MRSIEQLNQDIYTKIYDTYFEKFKQILLSIHTQKVDEAKDVYNLIVEVTEEFHEGNFDFRYFYKETIAKRDKIKDTIESMVSKYESPEYKSINELYNDWRNMIHEIGKMIGDEIQSYIQEAHKENIKTEELGELEKEMEELKDLEKSMENI